MSVDNDSQLCLQWENLKYFVLEQESYFGFRKYREVPILKNVSGHMQVGDLIAVLGSSGSGKTTLLAAVSQRIRGNVCGTLTLNSMTLGREDMIQISGFVPQFEINVKNFTAYEQLFYKSHFKMHRNATKFQKEQRVNEFLLIVGLRDVAHTRMQHLSGGERKRLSLAEQLIKDTPFLFCDEPTSGLDSYSSYTVIKTLRHLCTQRRVAKYSLAMLYGEDLYPALKRTSIAMEIDEPIQELKQTVNSRENRPIARQKIAAICTIHQPTSDIFEMFTHLIIIDKGHILYQGRAKDAIQFFNEIGYQMPKNSSPADFFLNTVNQCHAEDPEMKIILNKYKLKAMTPCSTSWVMRHCCSKEYLRQLNDFKQIRWIRQVYLLFIRFLLDDAREISSALTTTGFFLITCIATGILYSDIDFLQQSSVHDVAGALYTFASELLFTISYTVTMTFPNAMPLIRREVGEGTYGLSAYYAAIVLSYVPSCIIKVYFFLAIFHLMLFAKRGFLLYLSMGLVLSFGAIAATAYGLFLSSIFQSNAMIYEAALPFDMLFLIFSGVYINVDTIPLLKYTSLFFYTNEAMLYKFWIDVPVIACPVKEANPCFQTGREVLQHNSFGTNFYTFFF